MQLTLPASYAPKDEVVRAKVHSDTPAWQQAIFVVWIFTLLLPLGEFTLIRFACLAAILGLFARYYERTIPLLVKAWPILLFPILAVLSVGWSVYPAQAISQSILLVLTPFILVTFAVRLQPKEFFRLMMIAGLLMVAYFVLLSVPIRGVGAIMHKQLLAYHFLLVSVSGLITALNRSEALFWRALGLVTALSAFWMQMEAESVTSLLLGIGAFAALIGARFVWVPISRVEHLRTMIFLFVCIGVVATLLVFVSTPQNTVIADFFNLVGKESTLTGRTVIWNAAEDVVQESSFLGTGIGGFWHPDVGAAQTIAEVTHSKPGTNVSFHSVYWEARVHLGWIGVAVIAFALAWSIIVTFLRWAQDSSFINTGLLVMLVITASTIATESYLAGPFNLIVTTFYFGALSSFGLNKRTMYLRAKPVGEAS